MSRHRQFDFHNAALTLSRVFSLVLLAGAGVVGAGDNGAAGSKPIVSRATSDDDSKIVQNADDSLTPRVSLQQGVAPQTSPKKSVEIPASREIGSQVPNALTALIENPDDVVLVWGSRIIDPGPAKPATVEMTATNYGDCTIAGMKVRVEFKEGPNLSDPTAFTTTVIIGRSLDPQQSVKWRQIVNEVRGHGARAPLPQRWYTQFVVTQARGVACRPFDKTVTPEKGTDLDAESPFEMKPEIEEFLASADRLQRHATRAI